MIDLTVDQYLSLLPSANADKPDFLAVLEAVLQPIVECGNTIGGMERTYDVDTAGGVQLDVVGQWVGFQRNVVAPIEGVYFSLDIDSVGLDQGVWWGPGDPLTEIVSLPDDVYRTMLLAKIGANYWDGSLEQLQGLFAQFFAASPGTYAFVIDNFDMTMTIGISGVIPGVIYQRLFLNTQVPFPPAAVGSNVIITTEDGAPIFGLDSDTPYLGGLDHGAWHTAVVA